MAAGLTAGQVSALAQLQHPAMAGRSTCVHRDSLTLSKKMLAAGPRIWESALQFYLAIV